MTHPSTATRDLRAVRDTLPVALSVAPFGLVIGATGTQLGAVVAAVVAWRRRGLVLAGLAVAVALTVV